MSNKQSKKEKYLAEQKKIIENTDNPLVLLQRDFNLSYIQIANLFGYKKGYVYSFTSPLRYRKDIPLPLCRMCDAVRKIHELSSQIKKYEALKALLKDISQENVDNNLAIFDNFSKIDKS